MASSNIEIPSHTNNRNLRQVSLGKNTLHKQFRNTPFTSAGNLRDVMPNTIVVEQ